MTRKPIVAGMFYEGTKKELEGQIKNCFFGKKGPGMPLAQRNKKIIGVIAPHAGYVYSGMCAAFAYKEIAESKQDDLFIIIGLSHSGHKSCVSLDDWETPLGTVKTDKEFGKVLIENSELKQNESAHRDEHSIEAQIPFLQFIFKNKEFKILPIIASPDIDYKEIASSVKKTLEKTKRTAIIIASSDFTHYGFNFGYVPFQKNIKENMYNLDRDAIKLIENLDAAGFLDYIDKTGATICGNYPIAVLLELSKLLNGKKAELLQYYTSGDIVNDYRSAVGYAAIRID